MLHLAFDLDQTIFNHARGEQDSLREMYKAYFHGSPVTFQGFQEVFSGFNRDSWARFEKGLQDVEETVIKRFRLLSAYYSLKESGEDLSRRYWTFYIKKCSPYSGAATLLKQLHSLNFVLAVCSNGLERVQMGKLRHHGIDRYFSHFQYGTESPLCKPHPAFFKRLVEKLGVRHDEILFIGDSLQNDIHPAEKIGMNTLHVDGKYFIGDRLRCGMLLKRIKLLNRLS